MPLQDPAGGQECYQAHSKQPTAPAFVEMAALPFSNLCHLQPPVPPEQIRSRCTAHVEALLRKKVAR
eukprot:1139019-Pelagomonas_calceolata.AAC.1